MIQKIIIQSQININKTKKTLEQLGQDKHYFDDPVYFDPNFSNVFFVLFISNSNNIISSSDDDSFFQNDKDNNSMIDENEKVIEKSPDGNYGKVCNNFYYVIIIYIV